MINAKYSNYPELAQDLKTVIDTYKERISAFNDALFKGGLLPDEAISYFYSLDPIDENYVVFQSNIINGIDEDENISRLNKIIEFRRSRALALEMSAATTVASALKPGLIELHGRNWIREIDRQLISYNNGELVINPNSNINASDIIGFCIETSTEKLELDQIEKIVLAAEMLLLASFDEVNLSKILCWKNTGDIPKNASRIYENRELAQVLFSDYDKDPYLKASLIDQMMFDWLMGIAIEQCDKYSSSESDNSIEMHIKKLLSCVEFFKSNHIEDESKQRDKRKKIIKDLIDTIENKFIVDNHEPVIKGREKGDLHEYMWLLDSFVRIMIDPTLINKVAPISSTSNYDQPKVGKPKLNRAYDYMVLIVDSTCDYIQLKSRGNSKHGGEYHNAIKVVKEKFFRELNISWLRKKLEVYNKWIEGDFDISLNPKLDLLILESVNEYYGSLGQKTIREAHEFSPLAKPTTRSERRRRQRSVQKAAKKNRKIY
jgi:hypothetical protein